MSCAPFVGKGRARGCKLQGPSHCAAVRSAWPKHMAVWAPRLHLAPDVYKGLKVWLLCCLLGQCAVAVSAAVAFFGQVLLENIHLELLRHALGSFPFALTLPQRAAVVCESVYMCAMFDYGMPDKKMKNELEQCGVLSAALWRLADAVRSGPAC